MQAHRWGIDRVSKMKTKSFLCFLKIEELKLGSKTTFYVGS